MANRITTAILTGAGVAGLATAGATIYNTNETVESNERMHQETIKSNERIEMAKIEANERIEMERLEVEKYKANLSSKYDQPNQTDLVDHVESESIDYSITTYDNNPSVSDDSILINSEKLDNNSLDEEDNKLMETTNTSFEESNVSVDSNTDSSDNYVINSVLENDYLNTNFDNILQSAGFSFACFAFIGLFAGISLGLNLIIQNFGEKKIKDLPKWIQTLFQYYSKYLLLHNSIFVLFIIGSQFISLLLGLYLFFFGV